MFVFASGSAMLGAFSEKGVIVTSAPVSPSPIAKAAFRIPVAGTCFHADGASNLGASVVGGSAGGGELPGAADPAFASSGGCPGGRLLDGFCAPPAKGGVPPAKGAAPPANGGII